MKQPIPKQQPRVIDRVAMAIVGLMLGGLYLFFARLGAGSWRETVAMLASVATLFGVAFVGDRLLRNHVHTARRLGLLWALPVAALLGAAAGGAYAVISREHHTAGPVAMGAWIMAFWTMVGAIWQRRPKRASYHEGNASSRQGARGDS